MYEFNFKLIFVYVDCVPMLISMLLNRFEKMK